MSKNNRQNKDDGWSWLGTAGVVAAAAAAAGGIYYLATRNNDEEKKEQDTRTDGMLTAHDPTEEEFFFPRHIPDPFETGHLAAALPSNDEHIRSQAACGPPVADETSQAACGPPVADETVVKRYNIPDEPYICNLNTLLADIYDRHVALKNDDFQLHYRVFNHVFNAMHSKMKTVDKYYNRYSSNVQFAGSHFNRLKIKKPDEFDVDIVIRLPVDMEYNSKDKSLSDIIIEPKYPGFVQLRAGEQYKKIPFREDPEINKTAYSWLDDRNYVLRSKFTDWFKSVAIKALNNMRPIIYVDGVEYTIGTSSSGPAFTILIMAPGFRLDVDLVPALKFPESRWPVGNSYRSIPPGCNRNYWYVVPKPNKDGDNGFDENRSWRVAMQDQENKLLYNTDKMRKIICLLKYLRDSQNMNKIASYYITTIFLHELTELNNSTYWATNDMQTCFIHMINKFQIALNDEKIPYYWNKNHNLIGSINKSLLNEYKRKIKKLHAALQDPKNYKNIAQCFLSPDVYAWYEKYL